MKKHRPRPAPRRKPVRSPGPPPRRPSWQDTVTFEPDLVYDALETPDPALWLDLDESDRLILVELHHDRIGIELTDPEAHAAFHVAVENEIVRGDETPVHATAERLMAEGLDRHEAVHAIATVLIDLIHATVTEAAPADEQQAYYARLERLTAESWRRDFGEDAEDKGDDEA